MTKMKAADAVIKTLISADVKHIFGIPINFPLYESLYDHQDQIKHILTRHEEGAVFMAYGYSFITGNVGVCEGTSGPGMAHMVNGLAESTIDHMPIIALAWARSTTDRYRNTSQMIDQMNMLEPVTKWSAELLEAELATRITQDAIRIAKAYPPGAVHLDLLDNKLEEEADFKILKSHNFEPSYRFAGDEEAVKKAAKMILDSERPTMLIGWGAMYSDAAQEVRELAEKIGMPVATSEKAKGIIPEDHPLSLGIWVTDGFPGLISATETLRKADVILAIGTEFVSGKGYWMGDNAKLIEVNADPVRIGYEHAMEIGILGDAKLVLRQIIRECERLRNENIESVSDYPIVKEIEQLKKRWWNKILPKIRSNKSPINPFRVCKEIQDIFIDPYNEIGKNTVVTQGGGNHSIISYWVNRMYEPKTWMYPTPFGTLASGLPMAIGARFALRDVVKQNRHIVTIEGDGSFNMGIAEMGTAMEYKLPLTVCLFNNQTWGMEYDIQKDRGKVFGVEMSNPDYVKIADGFRSHSRKVEEADDLKEALLSSIKANQEGRPSLLDISVDKEEPTWNFEA